MDTVIDKGYTVIYNTTDGDIGFIGIDDHSGGYPYFSGAVEHRHVYKDISRAYGLLEGSKKTMGKYYGADKVHFGTMRVVSMAQVFEDQGPSNKEEIEVINKELAGMAKHKTELEKRVAWLTLGGDQ